MKQSSSTNDETSQPTLYLAFELSNQHWQLHFTVGQGQRPRQRTINAGDLAALTQEISLAKQRFDLPKPSETPVLSCYEAGRDGFRLHRFLASRHVTNLVVDSASIEVSRRSKHTKSDRLDGEKLLTMLLRYHNGDARESGASCKCPAWPWRINGNFTANSWPSKASARVTSTASKVCWSG